MHRHMPSQIANFRFNNQLRPSNPLLIVTTRLKYHMTPANQYIPVAGIWNRYFCSKCRLSSLAWILLIEARNLHLNSLGIQRRHLPAIFKSIIRHRKHSQPGAVDTLTLPARGHLCMRVHRGHKVFNFSELTTTKIFDHETDAAAVSSEIQSVHDAASLDFTPTLLEVDPQNRWYTETFIPGKQSSKRKQSDPTSLYDSVIVDHLCKIILCKPVRNIELAEYLDEIRNLIMQQLTDTYFDDEFSTHVHDFVCRIAARLEASESAPIHLTFTHGDFSFVNFLQTNSGIAVLDWESAQHRSMLNDLYNYFLTELYYKRTRSNLLTEINDAILSLSQRLASKAPELAGDAVNLKDVYRWLYYLERMHVLLDRKPSANQVTVILRSMDVFDKHESLASSPHSA